MESLKREIEALWLKRDMRASELPKEKRVALDDAIDALDSGKLRVATRRSDASASGPEAWEVHEWLKKAILLFLRFSSARLMGEQTETPWWDKISSKFSGWGEEHFQKAGFRAVPPCFVRRGAFIGRDAVLMPSYVNAGAYVDEKTMVDTWATIGSCAQIGKNSHISGGAGIGGVLEPLQARPTIVEDDCFIGARSEVAEGVVVGRGSVLSMGVFLSASTRIIDRQTGKIWRGFIPPYSVVVPGSLPTGTGDLGISLYCAVIVKTVDSKTREKTSINELLRGE